MYPHRIRLRGPWDCEPLAPPGATRSVTLPVRLRDLGLAGPARLTRRFGYPGRIDSYEHVWLNFADVIGRADVALNGQPLGAGLSGTFEFEITALLTARNRLEVMFGAGSDDAGLAGEVAMEVRRDAFLRDVTARRASDGSVGVRGLIVGAASLPLELYVLANGKTVSYSRVEGRAEGQPFDVSLGTDVAPEALRVELIAGAERWYAVDVPGPAC